VKVSGRVTLLHDAFEKGAFSEQFLNLLLIADDCVNPVSAFSTWFLRPYCGRK
jgi:hypothetical protein